MITVMYCGTLSNLPGGLFHAEGPRIVLFFTVPGLREGVSSGGSFAVYPGRSIRYRGDREGA